LIARNHASALKSEHALGSAQRNLADHEVKYILDVAFAALALLLLTPLLIVVAIAIRLDSKGPIIFKQTRTGLKGRTFEIYKFRTMTVLENGPTVEQATVGDKRVTRIGRWLRRSSIDELPQLINVIRGEMSLVGPRPHAQAHDYYYGQCIPEYAGRFAVRPGITGWAQVNGSRGETPTLAHMQRRVDLDLWYVQNWNHALDFKILIETVVVEVTQRGCGH
jgi:putative colanic acid biosynthesis UDP-glucose lipid carrier transferase